ncbi:MAG: SDR family NAD(P)-dependent oxidoreductase [Pseudomonadota bacterium]
MNETLTFEDRVVVITGAGNGIGRAYAHEFARRGAKVVVNDYGGTVDGTGNDTHSADFVVKEITDANGTAVPNYDSVVDGEKVVQTALDTWGRVDVLLNNAGIAYATPFAEMTPERWDKMMDVHLNGSHACTYAAWPHMQSQRYGRILFTSSPFGLHSAANFAHYSAAKAAVIGLARALTLEGDAQNIHANVVAPYSASRMTGRTNEQQATSLIGPRYLAQLAIWLGHESTQENGSVFEVGGGYIHKVRWALGQPLNLKDGEHTAENIAAGLDTLNDFSDNIYPETGDAHTIGNAVSGGDISKLFGESS